MENNIRSSWPYIRKGSINFFLLPFIVDKALSLWELLEVLNALKFEKELEDLPKEEFVCDLREWERGGVL